MFFYPFVPMFEEGDFVVEPYTFSGETYYNTVGDYDVNITTRSVFQVASSGDLIQEHFDGDFVTRYYTIHQARDFSFSAYNEYVHYEMMYEDIRIDIYTKQSIPEYRILFFYIEETIRYMEETVGEYQYESITLELGDIYGMESSGVIYCSLDYSEITIVHEVIHQWFYSMIGNDQYYDSFLDESITSFFTGLVLENIVSKEYVDSVYYQRYNSMLQKYDAFFQINQGIPLLLSVDDYQYYGYVIYYHGSTILRYYYDEFLQGNDELLQQIFSQYYDQYQGEIATVEDFLTVVQTYSGVPESKTWFELMLSGLQSPENRP